MSSRPHASTSCTSSASCALAFLPGRVSCAAEACGLFHSPPSSAATASATATRRVARRTSRRTADEAHTFIGVGCSLFMQPVSFFCPVKAIRRLPTASE